MLGRTPCLQQHLINSCEPSSSGASSQRFRHGHFSSRYSYSSFTGALIHSGICAPACLGLKYGPSRCRPSIGLLGSAISFVQVSQAFSIIGTVEEERVGKMLVVPYCMCASTATRKASSSPSIKSRPPPPCTCISMPPGTMSQPFASMISAPSIAKLLLLTSAILPSSTITEPPSSQPWGVRMRPLMICLNIVFSLKFTCKVHLLQNYATLGRNSTFAGCFLIYLVRKPTIINMGCPFGASHKFASRCD